MFQRVLTKYGVAWHLALLAAWAVFSLFTERGGGGAPLVWLALIAFEMALLTPTVLRNETFSEARRRSLQALLWDPLLYVGLAFLAMALIQAANGGCGLEYHADADVWRMGDPAAPWLPFAVRAPGALRLASVLSAAFGVMLIVRAALGRSAKRLLLTVLSAAAGAAGLFFSIRALLRGPALPAAFWDCATVRAAGFCFGFWAVVSLGVYFNHVADRRRGGPLLFLLGIVGNLLGALVFASPGTACITLILFVLLFVLLAFFEAGRLPLRTLIKDAAALLLLAGAAVFLFGYLLQGNPVMRKAAMLADWDGYVKAFSDLRPPRADAALAIFREHPWFGVGADGFGEFVGLFVGEDAKWAAFRQNQFCVLNDYLQLLAEGGMVGAALASAAAVILSVPIAARLRTFALLRMGPAAGRAAGRLSPVVLSGLAGILLAALGAGLESPFRSPAVLLSAGAVAAALPGFLPSARPVPGPAGAMMMRHGKTGRRKV